MNDTEKIKKGRSIKTKLLAVVAIVLVALTLMLTVISTQCIRYSTTQALKLSMQETAQIAADRVADYLELKSSLVKSIASRVGALYSGQLVPPYEQCDIAYLEKQMTSMAAAYGFDLLYAIDSEGYARTANHGNLKELAPEYYTAIAVDKKDSYMSDVVMDSGTLGGSVINMAAPITDESGQRIGMLVAKLDAALLSELVSSISVGEKGSTFIMNAKSECIAHKDPEMCLGGKLFSEIKDNPAYSGLNTLWNAMRDNEQGFVSYDYNGERLASYDTIDGTNDWTLAVAAEEREFLAVADRSVLISILVAAGLTLIAFFACLAVIRPIANRITAVTGRLERLAAGDLTDEVEKDTKSDEIGRLSLATAALVRDLGRMIDAVGNALSDMAEGRINAELDGNFNGDFERLRLTVEQNLSKLGDMVRQISRTSDEVSRGSAQIAEGATDLAQGAAEQAGSIEELYTTVTELTARAKEISNPDARWLDESEEELSEEGENARLEAIPTLVDKLGAAMESIRSRLAEVTKIAVVIDSIASETGMLALNASVEATHAGEYGRGFAVIASEIHELSDKCRKESRGASAQVDRIYQALGRGDQVVGYTIDAVREITQALSQVEAAISQISGVIEGTAATAEESAASSEELSAQAEVLRELAATFTYESED